MTPLFITAEIPSELPVAPVVTSAAFVAQHGRLLLRQSVRERSSRPRREPAPRDYGTLKPKDLVGMPWRLALALQADGWWLRKDIIWAKPNPMPESVTDRPTTAHEYVFLLAKSRRYFYDALAVREAAAYLGPNAPDAIASPYGQGFTRRAGSAKAGSRRAFRGGGAYTGGDSFENGKAKPNVVRGNDGIPNLARNLRSVWTIPTKRSSRAPPSKAQIPRAGTGGVACAGHCGTRFSPSRPCARRCAPCSASRLRRALTAALPRASPPVGQSRPSKTEIDHERNYPLHHRR